jgi:photosystem II stability/assembly factor-like uncharacterized protein
MIRKPIIALSFMTALFSCSNSDEQRSEKPKGWEIFETPVQSSLRGLSALTTEIAWASGSNGTWLRTTDGGQTWDHGVIAGLDTVDFRSIHAFDAETAIVVSAGQPAVVYKTIDGGKNWILKHRQNNQAFLDGISFSTKDRGYIVGDPVNNQWTILQTANRGDSWYTLDSIPAAAEGEVAFAASATSLLADGMAIYIGSGGKVSNLHLSNDQGGTWKSFRSPLKQGEPSQGIFSVATVGKGAVICVGGDYLQEKAIEGNSAIFLTTSQEWIAVETPPRGFRSGVIYFPQNKWVLAVGPGGSDYSVDEGRNWMAISDEGFHTIKMGHADGSVWACGANGRIAKLD